MTSETASSKVSLILLFALTMWSFSWFAGEFWNWNSTGRLFCTLSILERGETNIDPYAEHTGDKAKFDGHYYLDKAPGMTLLALAPVGVLKAVGVDVTILDKSGEMRQATYGAIALIATISTSALFSSLACLALFSALTQIVKDKKAALLAVVAIWFGTPLWGWSGCFFGHAVAAAFLTLGFTNLHQLTAQGNRKALRAAIGAGFLTGAILVEFTAAPAALMVFLWALWECRTWSKAELGKLFGLGLTVALVTAVPFFLYNLKTFGKLISAGYEHVVGFEGMDEGFMGLTIPQPSVMFELLFSLRPGLVWVAPVVILVPWGLSLLWRERRSLAVLSLTLFGYYLCLNSAYHYWTGGWSIGPRHMTACLPFLALPLALMYREATGKKRLLVYAITAISVLLAMVSASIGMTPSEEQSFVNVVLLPFLKGDFATPLGVYLKWSGYVIVAVYLTVAIPLGVGLKKANFA